MPLLNILEILNVMTDECLENWEAIMEDESGEMLTFVGERLGTFSPTAGFSCAAA